MTLRDCMLLLPGYELDGFPSSATGPEAAELLAGWVALWHPALLASLQDVPRWQQVEQPPVDLDASLFVLPSLARDTMPADLPEKISQAGGHFIEATGDWRALQTELLRAVGLGDNRFASDLPSASAPDQADLLAEFAALGYAYLQIQLMTRQLRYAASLDLPLFGEHLATASAAAMEGDHGKALEAIQACFDALGQERDHYYSLDVHLVDLTLMAPTTLGKSLERQLQSETPTSFLASGELLAQLASKSPERFARLVKSVQSSDACIAGGLNVERPHPLMTFDSVRRDYSRGAAAYKRLGAPVPTAFHRMTFGQSATSAALQKRHGYIGSLLLALAGGQYPTGDQAKVSWESPDGTFLSALAGQTVDAENPASFLSLGTELGNALDHQHVPTLVMAHWPGRGCEFYHLLRIVSKRTPAMGSWLNLESYFSETDEPYHQERLESAEFRCNWLAEGRPEQLIDAVKRFHQLAVLLASAKNLSNWAWQLEQFQPQVNSPDATESPDEEQTEQAPPSPTGKDDFDSELTELQDAADRLLDNRSLHPGLHDGDVDWQTEHEALDRRVRDHADTLTRRLAKKLLGGRAVTGGEADPQRGLLVLNPTTCPIRLATKLPDKKILDPKLAWQFADGRVGNDHCVAVDVPSQGFVAGRLDSPSGRPATQAALAEFGGLVRNEYMEAQICTSRGHIRTFHAAGRRGNRLSVQVCRRRYDDDGKVVTTEMVASEVRMLTSSNMNGMVRATGNLVDGKVAVGKFEIDYEVWRGSRVLEAIVRLSGLKPLDNSNPWREAYVLRVAWPTDAAILHTFSLGTQHAWSSGKTIAPKLIQIDESEYNTHYLTGGLAFHRRTDSRVLETVLACGDQTEVQHRIGFGVDLPNPLQAASQFMDRVYKVPVELDEKLGPGTSGWLATVDVPNVTLDTECPLVDAQGNTVGLRVAVAETAGRSTGASIRLMHDIATAKRVDYLGESLGDLVASGDKCSVPLRANEQTLIDILWA